MPEIVLPKKETVYSGPAVPQKETVYSGPAQASSKKETVFGGGALLTPPETVYGGAAAETAGTSVKGSTGGMVFDPAKHVAKKIDTSIARAATQKTIRRASLRFFVIGGLAIFEAIVFWQHPAIGYGAALVAVVFLSIGAFAFRMNRIAFLAAIAVYVLQTASYLVIAMTTDSGFLFVLKPLIVKCIVLYNLYLNYGLLTDLHDLENS